MSIQDEDRIRAVEDAIIEFRNIAKTVIVDIKERVKYLEAQHNKVDLNIANSCDNTGKEVSKELKDFKDNIYAEIRSSRKSVYGALASVFLIFIGAVVYFNEQDGKIHEKINEAREKSARIEGGNTADLKSILNEVRYIRGKVDSKAYRKK